MQEQFEVFVAASGALTARHTARGILVHSAGDPEREARTLADELLKERVSGITLVGAGLGYLERELSGRQVPVRSIEPFECLESLKNSSMSNTTSAERRSACALNLLDEAMRDSTNIVYVAPYVRGLIDLLPNDLAELIAHIVVLKNSRDEYAPLIAHNVKVNRAVFKQMSEFRLAGLPKREYAIACGSGPSLCEVLGDLRELRSSYELVACNSAVPILSDNRIDPDWVIALESHSGVAHSIHTLNKCARVVVFPCTDPDVLQMSHMNFAACSENADTLETGGGTTLLTAVDLASKIACRAVILAGADLSWRNGGSAASDHEESASLAFTAAPKFAFMREQMEKWIVKRRSLITYHVVEDSDLCLKGAIHLQPKELSGLLGSIARSKEALRHDLV